jgi:hypothetical protein
MGRRRPLSTDDSMTRLPASTEGSQRLRAGLQVRRLFADRVREASVWVFPVPEGAMYDLATERSVREMCPRIGRVVQSLEYRRV